MSLVYVQKKEPLKCLTVLVGEKRALNTFINDIIEAGFSGKVMEIGHVNNETLAKKFSEKKY